MNYQYFIFKNMVFESRINLKTKRKMNLRVSLLSSYRRIVINFIGQYSNKKGEKKYTHIYVVKTTSVILQISAVQQNYKHEPQYGSHMLFKIFQQSLKDTGEINFNNILNGGKTLFQHVINVKINQIFYILKFVVSLQNLTCILHLQRISSAQQPSWLVDQPKSGNSICGPATYS